jgi:hypothetical protein
VEEEEEGKLNNHPILPSQENRALMTGDISLSSHLDGTLSIYLAFTCTYIFLLTELMTNHAGVTIFMGHG